MKRILNLILSSLLLPFVISLNVKVSANEWEQDYKYYTNGIVDGGAYRIKNVETGLYMTLQNDLATNGTKIILSSSTSSTNQMFYVNYLGNNRYTFNIYNSETLMFSVSSSANATDLTISTKNTNVTYQRFKIYAVNSSEYNISTNVSSYSSGLYACYDETNGWHVEQNNSLNLTTNQLKWTFEKVDDRARDKYTAYYLRDSSTNLYLTVIGTTNGSQLSLTKFTGGENQRFKKYLLNDEDGFGYYYVPMIKTDMAVELSTSTILDVFEQNTPQKFTETADTSGCFKLSASVDGVTKYISKGNTYTYNLNTAYYLSTTTSISLAINFEFETAHFETPFIYNFNLETSVGRTLTSYSEKHIYIIKPTISGDYNFFIKRTSGSPGLSVYDQNDLWLPGTVTNYTDGQRYKVNLEKDKIYYIIVADYNSAGSSYTFYCKKDLLVYIHGMNTSETDGANADRRQNAAEPSKDLLNGYNYYDPIINTEADMTNIFVKNIDSTTGIVPLRAPIYVFTGHGASNRVAYSTGTDSSSGSTTRLYSDDFYDFSTDTIIYDMADNLFSAWVSCQTAQGTNNFAEAVHKAGSKCSLGFRNETNIKMSNKFIVNLFEEIEAGYSIADAVDRANSGISFWGTGLNTAEFYGDSTQVLKPSIPSLYSNMTLSTNTFENLSNILDDYTFMYENTRGTVKRYVKIINGYETDDYIDVYYSNGNIKGYYKSKNTYTESAMLSTASFENLFKEVDNYSIRSEIYADGKIYDKILSTETYDYIYTYNGETIPIRIYSITYINSEGYKYSDLKIVNLSSKSEISEDILYE